MERLHPIPKEEMGRLQEEAFEVNRLVDELRGQDKKISAQETSERIISEREITNIEKEEFNKGWGEKMLREVLTLNPEVEKVEQAPKETDEQRKTDAFVTFKKGRIGVQFTLAGFQDTGSNDLKSKFEAITKIKTVTYRGQEDVPLTMIRSNKQKFIEAFSSWEAEGRKGSPVDYLPQKERLANEFIKTMALVLEHKFNVRHDPEDRAWADYLSGIYQKREAELKKR